MHAGQAREVVHVAGEVRDVHDRHTAGHAGTELLDAQRLAARQHLVVDEVGGQLPGLRGADDPGDRVRNLLHVLRTDLVPAAPRRAGRNSACTRFSTTPLSGIRSPAILLERYSASPSTCSSGLETR